MYYSPAQSGTRFATRAELTDIPESRLGVCGESFHIDSVGQGRAIRVDIPAGRTFVREGCS